MATRPSRGQVLSTLSTRRKQGQSRGSERVDLPTVHHVCTQLPCKTRWREPDGWLELA